MSLYYILLLAIIQGLTEFLPVSSSGHLALIPHIIESNDQGQFIDVAVHIGTLGAVILYFWQDVKLAFFGFFRLFVGDFSSKGSKLARLLIVATLPVIICGLILKLSGYNEAIRSVRVIGWAMLLFGILLYFIDQKSPQGRVKKDWDFIDACKIGMWQAIALIPGSSRSGMTIIGARQLGFNRLDSANISMLMSIPTIIASGTLLGSEVIFNADWQSAKIGLIAAVFSFFSGFAALSIMMKMLQTISYSPYVFYRIILGIIILTISYT
ncbi:undecaprenyl-diphosphate phosphatase [Amylibacter sp.]|nr:undecaprenyl-diphosphate phosphatase [Amylibacter sp.]